MFNQRYLIGSICNKIVKPDERTVPELTIEEKVTDLQYWYDTMIKGNPNILLYKKLYGFSIADKRDDYFALAESTQNNFEFFCVMDAISQEIPSYHTDLVYPNLSEYNSLQCFGANIIRSNREIIGSAAYWENLLQKESNSYETENFVAFDYVDGNYVYVDKGKVYKIQKIDGVDVDDFIIKNPMIYNLYYDHEHKKPCRTKIVFHKEKGKKREVAIMDDANNESKRFLRWDVYEEEAYRIKNDAFDVGEKEYESSEIKDIKYIKINTINSETGAMLKKDFEEDSFDKCIIDLRDNWGGNPEAFCNYIYTSVGVERIEKEKVWYMPLYRNTKKEYSNIFNKVVYKLSYADKEKKVAVSRTKQIFNGDEKNRQYKIIILTSHNTGSAADEMVNILKHSSNVTVVGENTGGEGLMGTFASDYLNNSRLVFVYMPSKEKKAEVTMNSVYGTAPDIYSQPDIKEYMCKQKKDEKNRDTVLSKAINLY